MRRAISAVLTAVMLLGCAASLASCGSKEPVKQKVDHVYRVTSIPLEENTSIQRFISIGGMPYVIVRETETDPETEESVTVNVIYEVDAEEKKLKPSPYSEYTPPDATQSKSR